MSTTSQQVFATATTTQRVLSDSFAPAPVRGLAGNHTLQRRCAVANAWGCKGKEDRGILQRDVETSLPNQIDHSSLHQSKADNRTGLPTGLKTGLEALSGMDLSGVRVHRNSSRPDQVNALAYTEGQQIHVAPGQETHLPHEGWHVVQQMQGRVRPTFQAKGKSINDDKSLEHEADVMGARALGDGFLKHGALDSPELSHSYMAHPTIQREMKFEIQTTNRIWRNDGVHPATLLPRKYGPEDFLFKGLTGVRLESESHGVLEFETEWFRKWSALEEQLQEAVDMTKLMNTAPLLPSGRREFPFDVAHLKTGSKAEMKAGAWTRRTGKEGSNEKILGQEEMLEVEIGDTSWNSGIQSSEGIFLEQYESLLKEHEYAEYRESVIESAQKILDAANTKHLPATDLVNLLNFLELIVNYIKRGQGGPASDAAGAFADVKGKAAKQAFILMNRTDFSSIYKHLLSKDKEQPLFKKIVDNGLILKELGLKGKTPFFIKGYGLEGHHAGPTIGNWLAGIPNGKDLLSQHSGEPISAAMGKYSVETKKGEKDTGLVKFEVRNRPVGAWANRDEWVEYARKLFKTAAETRKRPDVKDDPATKDIETQKTTLIYDAKIDPPKTGEAKVSPVAPRFELTPKLTLTLGDEKEIGFDFEFRKSLPTLLDGKLQPFVYTGIGTLGLTGGVGTSFDPIKSMSLFLSGKAAIRTDWFTSLEAGGGLEVGWAFAKDRSLRLGIGWEEWQDLGEEGQRTHLLNVFFTVRR